MLFYSASCVSVFERYVFVRGAPCDELLYIRKTENIASYAQRVTLNFDAGLFLAKVHWSKRW